MHKQTTTVHTTTTFPQPEPQWLENDRFICRDGRGFIIEEVHCDGVICGSYFDLKSQGFFYGYCEIIVLQMMDMGMKFDRGPSAALSPAHLTLEEQADGEVFHMPCFVDSWRRMLHSFAALAFGAAFCALVSGAAAGDATTVGVLATGYTPPYAGYSAQAGLLGSSGTSGVTASWLQNNGIYAASSTNATHATNADYATAATDATYATSAGTASTATTANTAATATQANYALQANLVGSYGTTGVSATWLQNNGNYSAISGAANTANFASLAQNANYAWTAGIASNGIAAINEVAGFSTGIWEQTGGGGPNGWTVDYTIHTSC